MKAFGADPGRVRVVNPGIPEFPPVTEAEGARVLARLLPPRTGAFFLAVGTAEPRKDLPGLVRAFGRVAAGWGDVFMRLEPKSGKEPVLIKGEIPSPVNPPEGCRFHTRCPIARVPGVCNEQEPPLEPHGSEGQLAACHFAGEL